MTELRKIIHIDMDAFFASVEQLDNPDLRGKPVIVGGKPQGRGVVAACSYEARKFGIRSAMPCAKAYKLCTHAVFTRPRMHRYREISQVIMGIFQEYTSTIEPLSVDEAFLDVTRNKKNNPSASRLANIIRHHIHQKTGLTCSAGVSYNKFLAKIASDINKPNGIYIILPEQALQFLAELPISKFFGVGKATEKKMLNLGIKSGKQLRNFSKEDLIFHFGKSGSFFYNIVRGIDERVVRTSRERKSIGSETTLQKDIHEKDEINSVLVKLTEKVASVMESKKLLGHTVTLKVRYHDFSTVTRSKTLPQPTADKERILAVLVELLKATKAGQIKVRLLGLSISKLVDNSQKRPTQLMLPFLSLLNNK